MVPLQAEQRPPHQRAGVGLGAGPALGMELGDGMQPAPCLELDVAILGIVGRPLVAGLRPGGGDVTDEFGAMPTRPAGGGLTGRVRREAATGAQADQQADRGESAKARLSWIES